MDLKNSIIEKLNLGLQLMSRDEYYEVNRQIIFLNLRVFQTPAVLFLNSEEDGSDIERLGMLNFLIDSKASEGDVVQFNRSMSDPPLSDIDFKSKMTLIRTTLKQT